MLLISSIGCEFKQKTPGQFSRMPALHVKSSDNQDVYYYFKKLKGGYLNGTYAVSGIKRTGAPYTRFKYSDKSPRHKRRVIRHEQDDGYYIETHYYRTAENKMGSRTVEPKNKSERHFLKNRVRMQLAPVGPKWQKEQSPTATSTTKTRTKNPATLPCAMPITTSPATTGMAARRLTKIERRTPSPDDTTSKKRDLHLGQGQTSRLPACPHACTMKMKHPIILAHLQIRQTWQCHRRDRLWQVHA